MEFNVVNHQLSLGNINIIGVSASSLFMIGDVQTVQLSSAFDTPPTSLYTISAPNRMKGVLHVSKNISGKITNGKISYL